MKLGVYQCPASGGTQDERLTELERHIAGQGLDLLLCPELFSTGYDQGADYGDVAEAPDGPFAQGIAALARKHGTAIAYGYAERARDTIYNSAALIDASGRPLANHRKRLPSPYSFEERVFGRGGAVTFADLGDLRLAMIICYEVEFPENLRHAAQGGAHVVLVPTALGAEWGIVAEKLVPTRAFENGVWIAYADHAGDCGGLSFYGGSRIVAPDGQDAAVAVPGKAGLIAAPFDPARVAAARGRLPYLRDRVKL